jgi:hypothetical protein
MLMLHRCVGADRFGRDATGVREEVVNHHGILATASELWDILVDWPIEAQ